LEVDLPAAGEWILGHVGVAGAIEVVHQRPWSTVLRVPIKGGGVVWFKAEAAVQRFEPRLVAALAARWPALIPEVIALDEQRAWLLIADAGTSLRTIGSPPEAWLRVLPRYAELQKGEAQNALEHLAHGVPDLRVATWPARMAEFLTRDVPLAASELHALRAYAPRFTDHCEMLLAYGIPDSVQHDDLHMANVYVDGDAMRVIDWGDASISHPFASLVVAFRFLQEFSGIAPRDAWFVRLRDAYLEPWGGARLREACDLALRLGELAHCFAALRQRDALPLAAIPHFGEDFAIVLRRALAAIAAD
jgi:hypothetical protein